jgi:hypothetical protein
VCRGRVATQIIAKENSWWIDDHEETSEAAARQNGFTQRLWQSLKTEPALAFRAECPVTYDYPSNHKIHGSIMNLLASHERILEEHPEHGFSLRGSNTGGEFILAIQNPHWRFVRLSEHDREQLENDAVTALGLFFRYSGRGALVAFTSQIILNANDRENQWAKAMIRKEARTREKERLASK